MMNETKNKNECCNVELPKPNFDIASYIDSENPLSLPPLDASSIPKDAFKRLSEPPQPSTSQIIDGGSDEFIWTQDLDDMLIMCTKRCVTQNQKIPWPAVYIEFKRECEQTFGIPLPKEITTRSLYTLHGMLNYKTSKPINKKSAPEPGPALFKTTKKRSPKQKKEMPYTSKFRFKT